MGDAFWVLAASSFEVDVGSNREDYCVGKQYVAFVKIFGNLLHMRLDTFALKSLELELLVSGNACNIRYLRD